MILFFTQGLVFNFLEMIIIQNVVPTLPNVVKLDDENDTVISTLTIVVQINAEIENLTLMYITLISRCLTSQ